MSGWNGLERRCSCTGARVTQRFVTRFSGDILSTKPEKETSAEPVHGHKHNISEEVFLDENNVSRQQSIFQKTDLSVATPQESMATQGQFQTCKMHNVALDALPLPDRLCQLPSLGYLS